MNLSCPCLIVGLGAGAAALRAETPKNRVFLTTAVNRGELETLNKGLYFGGNRPDAPKVQQEYKQQSKIAFTRGQARRDA